MNFQQVVAHHRSTDHYSPCHFLFIFFFYYFLLSFTISQLSHIRIDSAQPWSLARKTFPLLYHTHCLPFAHKQSIRYPRKQTQKYLQIHQTWLPQDADVTMYVTCVCETYKNCEKKKKSQISSCPKKSYKHGYSLAKMTFTHDSALKVELFQWEWSVSMTVSHRITSELQGPSCISAAKLLDSRVWNELISLQLWRFSVWRFDIWPKRTFCKLT